MVTRDINERKRAEEAFQKLSETQSVILNNMRVGIALVPESGLRMGESANARSVWPSPEQCQGAARIIYADEESYQKVGDQAGILAREESFRRTGVAGDGSPFWCRLENGGGPRTSPKVI